MAIATKEITELEAPPQSDKRGLRTVLVELVRAQDRVEAASADVAVLIAEVGSMLYGETGPEPRT
jgi:hypothetical protein